MSKKTPKVVKSWGIAWGRLTADGKREMARTLGYNRVYIGHVINGESPGSKRLRGQIRAYFAQLREKGGAK